MICNTFSLANLRLPFKLLLLLKGKILFDSFIENYKLFKLWFLIRTEHNINLINNKEEYYIERVFILKISIFATGVNTKQFLYGYR